MKVTRENARQKIVSTLQGALDLAGVAVRTRWPGMPELDIAINKSPYMNVDIVYQDGQSVGLGKNTPQRRIGTLVLEINYKEGSTTDLVLVNNALDVLSSLVTDTDRMYPIRTYSSRPVSPTSGAQSGWLREALVTPFWYDTAR